MPDGKSMSVRTVKSAKSAKQLAVMRRLILEQVVYFLTEAGHSRTDIQRDLDEVMALPLGTRPKTKAPLMPLESLAYGEILSVWANDPAFADSSGNPILLPIKAKGRQRPSFERLCKSNYPALEPSKVLAELKRYGAVVESGANELRITETYIRLNRNDTESAMYSVMLLADLLHTMTLNRRDKVGLFQRCAWTDTLDPAYLPQLKVLVREHGMDKLQFFDKRLSQHDIRRSRGKVAGADGRTKGVRVTIGMYMSAG